VGTGGRSGWPGNGGPGLAAPRVSLAGVGSGSGGTGGRPRKLMPGCMSDRSAVMTETSFCSEGGCWIASSDTVCSGTNDAMCNEVSDTGCRVPDVVKSIDNRCNI
jgi:hypothetical protein